MTTCRRETSMSSSTMLLLRLRPIVSESSGRSSFWPTT